MVVTAREDTKREGVDCFCWTYGYIYFFLFFLYISWVPRWPRKTFKECIDRTAFKPAESFYAYGKCIDHNAFKPEENWDVFHVSNTCTQNASSPQTLLQLVNVWSKTLSNLMIIVIFAMTVLTKMSSRLTQILNKPKLLCSYVICKSSLTS